MEERDQERGGGGDRPGKRRWRKETRREEVEERPKGGGGGGKRPGERRKDKEKAGETKVGRKEVSLRPERGVEEIRDTRREEEK